MSVLRDRLFCYVIGRLYPSRYTRCFKELRRYHCAEMCDYSIDGTFAPRYIKAQ